MADVTVYPSSYSIVGTPNTLKPAATVGSDPWQTPDSTYTETWRSTRATGPPFSMLDSATGTWSAPTGTITDVVPVGRFEVMQDNTALTSRDVRVQMTDPTNLGAPFVGWFTPLGGSLAATDTIYDAAGADWSWEDDVGGTSKARLISVLQAGTLTAQIAPPLLPAGWTTASMSWGVRIHLLGLVVSTRSTTTTRRKYPNPTGLGVGTRRHWPRPRRGPGGIN